GEGFDTSAVDQRTGLHAATDFHARPRRRRRGRGGDMPAPMPVAAAAPPRAPVFETRVPADVLPPLAPYEIPAPAESESALDAGSALWAGEAQPGQPMAGEALHDDADAWLAEIMSAPPPGELAPVNGVEVLAASEAPTEGAASAEGQAGGDNPDDPYLPAWSA